MLKNESFRPPSPFSYYVVVLYVIWRVHLYCVTVPRSVWEERVLRLLENIDKENQTLRR